MDSDPRRLYTLEVQVAELQRQLKVERVKMRQMQGDIDDTQEHQAAADKRLHTAETWGRAILWTAITLGGFATQFTDVVTWLKK